MGVLATRSGFRPNAIGMSAARLTGVRCCPEGVFIDVTGIDIIDGTPILDIKPYLPYSDCITDAAAPPAPTPPEHIPVTFSSNAAAALEDFERRRYPSLLKLLTSVLAQDPRPAYDGTRHRKKAYGMCIYDLHVRWEPVDDGIHVIDITGPSTAARADAR